MICALQAALKCGMTQPTFCFTLRNLHCDAETASLLNSSGMV
jgi:hypothetical protein